VNPSVNLAVLTYERKDLLDIVVPSALAQRYSPFEVTVVDNGSTDGSADYVRERWPEVRVVELRPGRGVTAALNACLESSDTDFVALLNNDLELEPDWLPTLVRTMLERPEAGSAQGKLIDYDRRDVLDGAGDIVLWASPAFRRGHGEPDQGQYDEPEQVLAVSAAAGLYRRSALDDVGLFDEHLYCTYEDTDWGLRAQLAGWSCLYVPTAVAYHMGSATLASQPSSDSLYRHWRNAMWLVIKNIPGSSLLRHGHELLLYHAGMVFYSARDRAFGAYLKAWRDALIGAPTVLRQRRRIQSSRRVPANHFEGKLAKGRDQPRRLPPAS
jgi:GT2 family glycosyltransferase